MQMSHYGWYSLQAVQGMSRTLNCYTSAMVLGCLQAIGEEELL